MSSTNTLTIRVGTAGVPQAIAEIKSIGDGIKNTFASFGAALGIGFSIDKIVQLTKNAINSAEALGRLSQESGFTIQTLEALRKQVTESGLSFEDMQGSLVLFVAKMEDARVKGGAAMDVFRGIGQDVALAVAQGRPAEQVYGMIAQRFHDGAVAGREAAVAHELFGKSFREWVPILNEGIDGLDRFRALGGGITPDAVKNATDFNRELRALNEQFEEIFRQFAAQILPTLKSTVEYLSQLTSQTDAASQAATGMAEDFKGLVAVCLVTGAAFVGVGEIAGYSAAGYVEAFNTALQVVQRIVSGIVSMLSDAIALANDAALSFISTQEAMQAAITGHFKTAYELVSANVGLIKSDLKGLAGDMVSTFGQIPYDIADGWGKGQAMMDELVDKIYTQWTGVSGFLHNMFVGAPRTPLKPAYSPAPSTSSNQAASNGPIDPSVFVKQNEALIQQQQLQAKLIQSNPWLTEADKARQLLPILDTENTLLLDQLAIQRAISMDPTRTPEEKAKAQEEIVRLQGQQNDLLREQQTLQGQSNFGDQFGLKVTEMYNQFGTLAKQTANTFAEVFNTAINSISKGITGLIEGTTTWSNALMQIGTSILDSLIQSIVKMFVTWILQMTILAALQKLFGQQSNQQASQSAAAWGPAAVAASIASYGAAAAVGTTSAIAGMTVGAAFAAGLSGGAGFAQGGYTGGGGKYDIAGLVHRGEIVWSQADIARAGGVSMVESMRTGGADSVGGSPQVHVHMWPDENGMVKFARDNPDFQHVIADTMGRHISKYLPRA